MSNVIYAKYNRTRVPKYQTVTKILLDGEKKYVVKEALMKEAREHVNSLEYKCSRLSGIYNSVKPLGCYIKDDVAFFDYCEAQTVSDVIESKMLSIDDIVDNVKKCSDIIFSFKEDSIVPFFKTEDFVSVFGNITELDGVPAVVGADVDLIFDNILCSKDGYICIDYEWFVDFVIPIDFIRYRCLFYFYSKNSSYFKNEMEITDFMNCFGIDDKMQEIYKKMDESFQQMVHGKNWKNIYTRNYEKNVCDLKKIMHTFPNIESTIIEQAESIDKLNNYIRDRESAMATERIEVNEKISDLRMQVSRLQKDNMELKSQIDLFRNLVAEKEWMLVNKKK